MLAHTERTKTCFLALDILFALLEHLPPAELLIIARSCKTLHGPSIRALLRQGVTLTNTQQLRSFCAFLQADVPVRAPLIRNLNLSFRPSIPGRITNIVPVANHPLLWLFQHMNALDRLRIKYADLWLQVVQGLDTVLAELTTLRSLYIAWLGNTLYKVIDSSKSQLIEIEIDCGGPEIVHMGEIPNVVKAYHTTLERIIARNCGVFSSDSLVFPRMRALALRNCEGSALYLLYSVFPNLRYLEVSGTYVLSEDEPPWWQRGSHVSVEHPEHPWLDLEHLCGPLYSLCRLPLSRRTLKHLDVDHVDSSLPNLERLHTLIASTSPSRLIVRTGWQEGGVRNIFFNTEKMPALLDVPEAALITHFVLDMLVHRESGTEDALLVSTCPFESRLACTCTEMDDPTGRCQHTPFFTPFSGILRPPAEQRDVVGSE